jgi:hypothetical protein
MPLAQAAALSLSIGVIGASACGGAEVQGRVDPKPEGAQPAEPAAPKGAGPLISVKGGEALVDGAPAGSVSGAVQEGRVGKIEPLFALLEQYKKAFAQENPGQPFPGRCRVNLPPDTPDAVWRSVLMTAFLAGYTSMSLEGAGERANLRAVIPLPPDRGGPKRPLMITIRSSKFDAIWLASKNPERRREAARSSAARPDGSVELRELADALKQECGASDPPCFDVISLRALSPLSYADFAAMTRAIAPAWGPSDPSGPAPLYDFLRSMDYTGLPEPARASLAMEPGSGRIEASEVLRVLNEASPKFAACHQEGLKRDPALRGKVVLRLTIDPNGRVSSADRVTSKPTAGSPDAVTTMPDTKVVSCVVEAARGLSFPKPQGGRVTFLYPLTFTPASQ